MLDGLPWITSALGAAFAVAGVVWAYYAFGLDALGRTAGRLRLHLDLRRLLGRHGEPDPAAEVQQALNDALRAAPPSLDEADAWPPLETGTAPARSPESRGAKRARRDITD